MFSQFFDRSTRNGQNRSPRSTPGLLKTYSKAQLDLSGNKKSLSPAESSSYSRKVSKSPDVNKSGIDTYKKYLNVLSRTIFCYSEHKENLKTSQPLQKLMKLNLTRTETSKTPLKDISLIANNRELNTTRQTDLLVKYAKENNLEKCVELIKSTNLPISLLRQNDDYGNAAIHYACCNNNPQLLKELIKHSSIRNQKNSKGQTPLMISCEKGYLEIATILTDSVVDLNLEDASGNTALHYAVKGGHKAIVELLLENKRMDANKANKRGLSAIDFASTSIKELFNKKSNSPKPSLFDIKGIKNRVSSNSSRNSYGSHNSSFDRNSRRSDSRKIDSTRSNLRKGKEYKEIPKASNEITIHRAKSKNVLKMFEKMNPFTKDNSKANSNSNKIVIKSKEAKTVEFSLKDLRSVKGSQETKSSINLKSVEKFEKFQKSHKPTNIRGSMDSCFSNDEEKFGPDSLSVIGMLGKGSFGEVYLVEKKETNAKYALKVLHKSKIVSWIIH